MRAVGHPAWIPLLKCPSPEGTHEPCALNGRHRIVGQELVGVPFAEACVEIEMGHGSSRPDPRWHVLLDDEAGLRWTGSRKEQTPGKVELTRDEGLLQRRHALNGNSRKKEDREEIPNVRRALWIEQAIEASVRAHLRFYAGWKVPIHVDIVRVDTT